MSALTPPSKFAKVKATSDIQVPKSSVFDNLRVGAKQGFEETTISYLQDYNLLQRARNGEDDTIPFEEWNESNPYYREDIKWSEDLSWNIARNIQDELAIQEEAQATFERATTGGKVARYAGMFGGAALDPVNFIPFTFGAGRAASWLSRAARVGAANVVIEGTTITPLALAAQEARGIEFGANDVALNLSFAFGAGFGLSALADGARGAFRLARSATVKTDEDVVKLADEIESPLDESAVSSDIDLVGAKTILGAKRRTGTADATDTNLIKNYSFDNIETTPVVIKTDGTISLKPNDRGVKVFKDDRFLVVEGSGFDILKVINTLQTRFTKEQFPQIEFRFQDTLQDEIIAFENIPKRVELLEKQIGRKAALDETVVERTRVQIEEESFDIEINETTGKVKAIYEVTNNKRGKKLSPQRTKQVKTALSEKVELKKKELNTELQDSAPQKIDQQLVNNRGGRLADDELLKSKEAYRNKNIIDAADESRGTLYNSAAKDIDKMIVAVLSQPVFKKRQLDDLGISFNKNTGELRINDVEKANADSLGRILVELKNKQQQLKKEKQAVEELHVCLPLGT